MPDSIDLPAATCLWLTDPGNAEKVRFLSGRCVFIYTFDALRRWVLVLMGRGRYVEASWDLNEVLAKREEIVSDNLLVTKLAGPVRSSGV